MSALTNSTYDGIRFDVGYAASGHIGEVNP